MRKHLCLLSFLLFSLTAQAQQTTLASFNLRQMETMRIGMLVLGVWALLNIVIGSFRLTKATRSKRYFHQMNIYWNIINVSVAGWVFYFLFSDNTAARTLAESMSLHMVYIKLLYLVLGVSTGCLALGLYLREKSKNPPNPEQNLGWGDSVILQGLFLLVLSLTLILLLEAQTNQLIRLLPA